MKNKNLNNSKKVSFLVAGAQKAGTTALDSYLRLHPELCMAQKKEVHFFDNEQYFNTNKKIENYDTYHQFFQPKPRNILLGESTPIYFYWKPAIKRIHQYNKDMKFIILLRNPIERAYSHWNMESKNYYSNQANHKNDQAVETLTFHQAIHKEKQRLEETLPLQNRHYSYIDRGFYFRQLQFLLNYFPQRQLLILKSDWLNHNLQHTLEKVFDFLEINKGVTIEQFKPRENSNPKTKLFTSPIDNTRENPTNTGAYQREISQIDKRYLIKVFKNDILQLETLLNWNCHEWLEE